MISLEDGITATGFRKVAAYVEKLNPDTRIAYVGTRRYRSMWKSFVRKMGDIAEFTDDEIDNVAQGVAKNADLIAFSSMTGYSDLTKRIAKRVREIAPQAYTMWGGIHPIIYPEDAITADVDAICTGEGEFAFEEVYDALQRGVQPLEVQNFWFKRRDTGAITRNPFRPLETPEELETLPYPKYGGPEMLYRHDSGEFTQVTRSDYLANNGLAYPAIWSIGCPLHCTFCGNTVFIANDPAYKKIRHTSPNYVITEVERARAVHPHLQTVLFYDDSFLAIPIRELTDFATQWRERVGLPFCVYGVIPSYVQRDKLEVLTWAGLNRVRMGIQSGSDRILKFYRRPTPIPKIEHAAQVISEFAKYHINPSYDIIVDNPVETRQDVIDTLELVYRLARPFTLNIFSLRVIPNTVLEKQMSEAGIDIEEINQNYTSLRPTWANVLLYVLMLWRPPRKWFDRMLKRVRAYSEPQHDYNLLIALVRIPWLIQQGLRHMRFLEFSVITGAPGYILWRLGIVKLWSKLFARKLTMPSGKWAQAAATEAATDAA
ncbi:MAG TPA: radical SAM protein [Thermoanaerobaculia bacterium]|nr:radical SAM protein [Thermoanaerobaculia bacterium]